MAQPFIPFCIGQEPGGSVYTIHPMLVFYIDVERHSVFSYRRDTP